MNDEMAEYRYWINTRIEMLVATLDGLTPAQLNWRPHDGANSAWVLATHTLGNARAFILGIAAGRDVTRDRPAEFASSGDDAARLRDQAQALMRDIDEALASIDPATLDDRIVPPQALFGENPTREVARRYAILQVVNHVALHLGHLELTRDLALRSA
jgi:hypothetical protein